MTHPTKQCGFILGHESALADSLSWHCSHGGISWDSISNVKAQDIVSSEKKKSLDSMI